MQMKLLFDVKHF